MKIIVVAGGTGGHIYPAIAIINKIREKEPDSDILYIGTSDRMEKDIIPKLGFKFVGLEMAGLNRRNVFSNISVFKKFKLAVKKSREIIHDFKPDVVIGAGGYVTVPVLYAAHKEHRPILIHEQNSVPGISNKFIGRFADRICVSLPNSLELFPKKKTVYTGNPRSEEIMNARKLLKTELGFLGNKKLVIVVMGSLGSTTMTLKIRDLIPGFNKKSYQVLIITGKKYYDDYKNIKISSNVKVVPFMDDLICLMKDSDLIISRAGASTIAEITAIGLPAILVPSPYVTNNHQYRNAKELEDAGACVIVLEKDFSKDRIIREIDKLFDHKEKYDAMVQNSKKFGLSDSATRIYNEIRKLVE